jgi:hypothetical protein
MCATMLKYIANIYINMILLIINIQLFANKDLQIVYSHIHDVKQMVIIRKHVPIHFALHLHSTQCLVDAT